MHCAIHKSSRKLASSAGRRRTQALLSITVIFTALQICQSFVPYVLRKAVPLKEYSEVFRLQQQLTQIDPIRNNERGTIGIEKSMRGANNTESFGILHPRKSEADCVIEDFPKTLSSKLSKQTIESTVEDMLRPSRKSMGLFGDALDEESTHSLKEGNSVLASSLNAVVKLATAMDDIEIANLRLSVFSNFNPESRKLFCERSCQLLSSRRRRGAACVVARKSDTSNNKHNSNTARRRISHKKDGTIVGTAEISYHEFSGTKLERSRPKHSILYVTEVAVDSNQRRKGIARLMMDAIDTLALTRTVETVYLHVDVTNLGAINLYEAAGYRKLESDNPLYLEFTTKLNLHDGATKGRNHYLMAKDVREPTWFNLQEEQFQLDEICTTKSRQRTLGINVMSIA